MTYINPCGISFYVNKWIGEIDLNLKLFPFPLKCKVRFSLAQNTDNFLCLIKWAENSGFIFLTMKACVFLIRLCLWEGSGPSPSRRPPVVSSWWPHRAQGSSCADGAQWHILPRLWLTKWQDARGCKWCFVSNLREGPKRIGEWNL